LARGAQIYRNHDHEFLGRLGKSRPERRIAVALVLRGTSDGLSLAAADEDGVEASLALSCSTPPAEKPEQALEAIRSQLARCGGTPFVCREVAVDLPVVPFVPLSALNALRRGALERLTEARAVRRPVARGGAERNEAPYPAKTLSFEGNVLNRHAEAFYRRHGVTAIEPAAESGLDLRGRRVMTTRYCLKQELGLCPRDGGAPVTEPLHLVDDEGHRLELRFDCRRCRMEVWLPAG